MEKVLSQAEIDALFRAAQGGSTAPEDAPGSVVEPWDLQHSAALGKEQLHSLNQLYETFARNLGGTIAGYLSDKFEVALVAVEQLTYRDFLARSPEVTYYGSFRLSPGDGRGILHMDLSLAFAAIDLLLGGSGMMPQVAREVTEIEESLLQGIGHLACQELRTVLTPLGLEVEFERRQTALQMPRIMPPQEKTLTLTFEVSMAESKGTLNIVFPSIVSSALMRKMRAELVYERAQGPAVHQEGIGRRLLESTVDVVLATAPIAARVPELLALRPGAILVLRHHVEEPALVRIGDCDCWSARPVNSCNRRAAHLLQEHYPAQEGNSA